MNAAFFSVNFLAFLLYVIVVLSLYVALNQDRIENGAPAKGFPTFFTSGTCKVDENALFRQWPLPYRAIGPVNQSMRDILDALPGNEKMQPIGDRDQEVIDYLADTIGIYCSYNDNVDTDSLYQSAAEAVDVIAANYNTPVNIANAYESATVPDVGIRVSKDQLRDLYGINRSYICYEPFFYTKGVFKGPQLEQLDPRFNVSDKEIVIYPRTMFPGDECPYERKTDKQT